MYYVLWRHHILPTGTFPCCAFVKIVGLSHILGRIIPDGHSTASVNVVKCDLKKRNRTMVAGRLNNIYFVGRDIRFVSKLNRDSEQRVRSGMGAYAVRRHSFGLLLAITQADARPAKPVSFRQASVWPLPRQTPGPSCPYPSYRPPSGHCPGRRQALHAHILQIGLHLTQP